MEQNFPVYTIAGVRKVAQKIKGLLATVVDVEYEGPTKGYKLCDSRESF